MTARLHAVEDGPADASVLVLGPSLGTDIGLFDPQVAELARTHRVIRYDLRGHGGSEVVPGPCTMTDLAGDVLALLGAWGVEQFSYAGVSVGGAIGQQLALTVPDRLEELAIIASAAQFDDPPSWAVRAAQVREQGTEILLPSRTGTWFTPERAEEEPAAAERLLAMLRTTPAEATPPAVRRSAPSTSATGSATSPLRRWSSPVPRTRRPPSTWSGSSPTAARTASSSSSPEPPTCPTPPTPAQWTPRCEPTSATEGGPPRLTWLRALPLDPRRDPATARAPSEEPGHRPPDRAPRERAPGRSARPVRNGTGHRAWRTPG